MKNLLYIVEPSPDCEIADRLLRACGVEFERVNVERELFHLGGHGLPLLATSEGYFDWEDIEKYAFSNGRPLMISDLFFKKELGELVKRHESKWVAYHRNSRIGIYDSQEKAVKDAVSKGVPEHEIYVQLVESELELNFGWSPLYWS